MLLYKMAVIARGERKGRDNRAVDAEFDVLHELLLSDLQLQHDGAELHVEVVGSFQLPLIVLPDIQSVPEKEKMN